MVVLDLIVVAETVSGVEVVGQEGMEVSGSLSKDHSQVINCGSQSGTSLAYQDLRRISTRNT